MLGAEWQLTRRSLWLLLFLALLSVFALWAGAAMDPLAVNVTGRYTPPSLVYPFGTDSLGRDQLARTLYAVGLSFKVVLYALLTAGAVALVLGGIAGFYYNRWPDHLISWIISLLTAMPFLVWVVAIFAVVPAGLEQIYVVIGLIVWAGPARLVREVVAQLRQAPFVVAERAFGYPPYRILFRSFFVYALPPVFYSLLYAVPELVAVEVGLSFFGLGAQPPIPTLGRMIYEGMNQWSIAWWVTLLPPAVFALILGLLYRSVSDSPIGYENDQPR